MSNFPPPPTSSPPPPTLLAEIHRAAKVSFCPSPLYPSLLAAGTIAGTIDDSFETRSSLELYDLALSSSSTPSPPVLLGSLTTKDCFHSVAWGIKGIGADLSHGLIAGGMSDGAVNIWNAAAIIKRPPSSSPSTPSSTSLTSSPPQPSSSSSALLSRSEQHKGQVHALQFHPTQPNLLASGASDGVVLVWDLADVRAPRANKPNPALTGHEHGVTCVGWNKKVPQIVASSSETGETTVWDLRQKKCQRRSRTPHASLAIALHRACSASSLTAHFDCVVVQPSSSSAAARARPYGPPRWCGTPKRSVPSSHMQLCRLDLSCAAVHRLNVEKAPGAFRSSTLSLR